MRFRKLDDMDLAGKRVIVRADLNVPLDESEDIADDNRIVQALPTIKRIIEKGARQIVLMSHLGRPERKNVSELRLDPVAARLSELLDMHVTKLDDCVDISIPDAKIVLLENLRFHPEEKENYEFFAKKLASYADVYVNDAFGTSHRAHASVAKITEYLPSCAGLLLEKELRMLGDAIKSPERPFIAIIGGAKISDKINLINNLLKKVDRLLLGGAMIFTFYKAQGHNIGNSLYEEGNLGIAKLLLHNEKLVLPEDVVAAKEKKQGAEKKTVPVDKIPDDWIGLDIGNASVARFKQELGKAKTVVWNGPLGLFEIDDFAVGTEQVAKFLAGLKAKVIIGGGDSASAIKKLGLSDKVTHISTGGGASLAMLEGKTLPAVQALEDNLKRFP